MESLLALLGLALALFASTNVDDLFVLVGFFANPKFSALDIVIGQFLGFAAIFGASVSASMLSLVVPRAYIGLLGIVPILIGAKKLYELFRSRDSTVLSPDSGPVSGAYVRPATVAIVTIANGGDNIGIYMPSFAIRSGREIAVIAVVFAVMTAVWCFAAYSMVSHPKMGKPIRRYGHRVAPLVLIGLGILILDQAGSMKLLFHRIGH
jgi:cadmium resistance protein CadD (predicted permease)